MGDHAIRPELDGPQLRQFTKRLLQDVHALEKLLSTDLIERGVRRIGAEQELFLVGRAWRPAAVALDLLDRLRDDRFTTELARYNLEVNLEPLLFSANCLRTLETRLDAAVAQARRAAKEIDAEVVMAGILPTLRRDDLSLDNMTPIPRYFALNRALNKMAGGPYDFDIQGVDELSFHHDSVMAESANTSFQVHFQVSPEEFARFYNLAQAATGPVLAAAVNAPILFGKRLWRETRIALFQQSIDTRSPTEHRRAVPARVSFGQRWVKESVLEIFKEEITRFKVLFGLENLDEDPFEEISRGRAPRLQALTFHNGTVWQWNRACYGVSDGLAHLRIEARFLPSGPSVLDEVANAAFWFGVLSGMIEEHHDITRVMPFETAKGNFLAAARHGLQAQFTWLGGGTLPAQELIRHELLPLAREGLRVAGVDAADISRYLDVVEERVETGQTGATWILQSLVSFGAQGTRHQRMAALTAAMVARQTDGSPVAEWTLADLEEAGTWPENYQRVDQYMETDLITVHEDEPIDLVANLMDWQHVRYVPVEDEDHRLVGLVSTRTLMRYLASDRPRPAEPVPVEAVMERNLVTISPDTDTLEAVQIMNRERIGCLPVVESDTLVGIVTETTFLTIAKQLIQEKLRG